jgi:NADH-quinone oxidoreductase subunit L
LGTEKLSVFTNHFHHFAGASVHETIKVLYEEHLVLHEIATIPWSWVPIVFSVVVALGGIGVGYLMYGRNPIESVDQEDPIIGVIGQPIFAFLENKWYWDELYDRIFVQPTNFFSEVIVYQWVDKGLIDGTLHLIANTFYTLGGAMLNTENAVFGRGVDWVKDRFLDFAKEWKTLQSGKVQEYALLSMLIAFVFATFLLLVNAGVLNGIVN